MGKIIGIIFVCLLMPGCSDGKLNNEIFKKCVPQETEKLAIQCLRLIKSKKTKKASNLFVHQYRTPKTIEALNKISTLMNSGTLKSQKLVNWNVVNWTTKNSFSKKTILEYQQDLSGKWLLLTITILDDKFIAKFNALPLNKPLQEINAFTLSHKPVYYIPFLLLYIFVPLFSIFTLIVCFTTKLKKRKWLWIIFIIFGVGKYAMNWTSGQIFFSLLHFQLGTVGIFRQGACGPWIVSTSIPLGAILFGVFKNRITKSSGISASMDISDEQTNTDNVSG